MSIRKPIIVVEDDIDDRELLQAVFQDLGIENKLLFFKEGNEALKFLRATTEQPFIIITDVNLPGMNGIELRENILSEDYLRKKSIPFVFLSTSDGKAILQKVYQLEVQGYFQKQHTYHAVKDQIKLIIDYWRYCKHPNSN